MAERTVRNLQLIEQGKSPPPKELSDEGLMLLSAEGDTHAFSRLVSMNETAIRRFCFGLLGNRAQADEVAQEIFLKLWQGRKRYHPRDKFKAYLYTIARNRCLSVLRRRALLSFVGIESAPPALHIGALSEDRVEVAERDAIVHACISRLPRKLRAALLLRFVDGMTYEEISRITGRGESTVRSRVHHGLKQLAKILPEEVSEWND